MWGRGRLEPAIGTHDNEFTKDHTIPENDSEYSFLDFYVKRLKKLSRASPFRHSRIASYGFLGNVRV